MKVWLPGQLRSVVQSALTHLDKPAHDFLRDVIFLACRAMSDGATRDEVKQALVGLAKAPNARREDSNTPAPGPVKVVLCGKAKV